MSESKPHPKKPQKKLITSANEPIDTLSSGTTYTSERELPDPTKTRRIKGIPRWIYGGQLMACAELLSRELDDLIEKGQLVAYKSDGGKYRRYFDYEFRENLHFSLVELFELEEKGVLSLGDSLRIEEWREKYRQAQDASTSGPYIEEEPAQKDAIQQEVRDKVREAKPEVLEIYEAVKKVGFSGRKPDAPAQWKRAVNEAFITNEERFRFVRNEYIEDKKLYVLNPGHEKRDFMGALLKKIIEQETGHIIGGQKLYSIFSQTA